MSQIKDHQNIIGLDLKTFSLRHAGIGRYTVNLVQALLKRSTNQYQYINFTAPGTDTGLLAKAKGNSVPLVRSRINSTVLRSLLILPWQTAHKKVDLFHSTDSSTINLLPLVKCKRLSTIHDIIVCMHPEYFTRKHVAIVRSMATFIVKKADHIIADSVSTKNDLLKVFPNLHEEKVSVIYLGSSSVFRIVDEEEIIRLLVKLKLPRRYFLSLATQEPRKNLGTIIKAFMLFKQNSAYEDIGLVLVGGAGWLESGVEKNQSAYKKEKIFSLGFLEDQLLPILYSGALAFVYPSFYEGFGLPVLEAMSCGRPIITADNSSLPEVAGEAALYVDPNSTESIKTAMATIADSQKLQYSLSKKALKQSKLFSWEKTAEQTEAVYNKLLS